jgi:hypothetical protein
MSLEIVKVVQAGSLMRRHHKRGARLIGLGIGHVAEIPNTRATRADCQGPGII